MRMGSKRKWLGTVSCNTVSPADRVLAADAFNDGTYLFDDGTIGRAVDYTDESDADDDHGEMYIDRWSRDGDYLDGACLWYVYGSTLRDFCDRNGYPLPVRMIPECFVDALEDDADAGEVFAVLDRYLAGSIDEGRAEKDLGRLSRCRGRTGSATETAPTGSSRPRRQPRG